MVPNGLQRGFANISFSLVSLGAVEQHSAFDVYLTLARRVISHLSGLSFHLAPDLLLKKGR
jgi:hypothetical protein